MNEWEAHFQRYVQGRLFNCEKIPETDKKTSDFRITAGNLPHEIIAEVKTLAPNELDKRVRNNAEEFAKLAQEGKAAVGVVDTYWVATQVSIRNHLNDAVRTRRPTPATWSYSTRRKNPTSSCWAPTRSTKPCSGTSSSTT